MPERGQRRAGTLPKEPVQGVELSNGLRHRAGTCIARDK